MVALGVAAVAAVLATAALGLDRVPLEGWIAVGVAAVLLAGSVPLLRWVARVEGDPWLYRVMWWGLVATLVFSMARYYFIFVIAEGSADASLYNESGRIFVERLRAGQDPRIIPDLQAFPPESERIGYLTGLLYTVTGPSVYGGFLVFAWVGFLGRVLMVRALRRALPEADPRRYAVLVMFLPSLLFWPASIGKEALMMGCVGVAMYGAAQLLGPRPSLRGAPVFALGVLAIFLVRPHIGTMSVVALGLALAVGALFRSGRGTGGRGRVAQVAGLVLVAVLAVVGFSRLTAQFERFEGGAEGALEGTLEQTSVGGSEFDPPAVDSPVDIPWAVVSVLFRPFPWEAGNLAVAISAAESLVLWAILLASWRRVASLPSMLLRRPYLVFTSSYVLLYAVAFSYIANFGILSRQRVLALPALLVLIALPQRRAQGLSADRVPGATRPEDPARAEMSAGEGTPGVRSPG